MHGEYACPGDRRCRLHRPQSGPRFASRGARGHSGRPAGVPRHGGAFCRRRPMRTRRPRPGRPPGDRCDHPPGRRHLGTRVGTGPGQHPPAQRRRHRPAARAGPGERGGDLPARLDQRGRRRGQRARRGHHRADRAPSAHPVRRDQGRGGDAARQLRQLLRHHRRGAAVLQRVRPGDGREGQLHPPADARRPGRRGRPGPRRRQHAPRRGARGRHRAGHPDRLAGTAQRPADPRLGDFGHGERDGDDGPQGHRRAHPGRERAGRQRRDASRGIGHRGRGGARLPARLRPGGRYGDGMAGFRSGGGARMIYKDPRDQVVDDAAIKALTDAYGERVTSLPPVAIVIAAYNEAGAIGPVIEALPAEVCGLATATIVVADGCADSTVAEAAEAGAMVADVPVNRGQGAALRLGYRIAREGGAAYIITTDADGQYNPAEMATVLGPVVAGEADFVTGSRQLGSQETKDMIRRAGVRFFASTISLLTGQKISDTTFGLRAMRSEVTGAVQLAQPQYQASELLIGVITHGYKIAEVPATIHRRRVGESKKGQNPLYKLHIPGVNNFFYGLRFARVAYGTYWRERQRSRSSSSSGRSASVARANGSGPGSVEASASSAAPGGSLTTDAAKRT